MPDSKTKPSKVTIDASQCASIPMGQLGIDYFNWDNKKYLVVTDYMSCFLIVRCVANMTVTTLVDTLRAIMGEYGIPREIFSDQGTQFTSHKYLDFAKKYQFKVSHSSPRYPQSNGFIESMIKLLRVHCKEVKTITLIHT